ncbi:MAG: FliH/SctL family protein [Kyrpidia sp.]|nr:FliH/SctL family protein [Kyrpidia sp.]
MSSRVVKSAVARVLVTEPVVLAGSGSPEEPPEGDEAPERVAGELRRLAAEELEQARREARELLLKARAEAAALVEQAREQIGREREAELHQAREEGRRAGWEEGLRSARAAYEERLKEVEALRAEVEAWRQKLSEVTEIHVADVAVAVAERVVRGLVEVDRGWVRNLAADAVAALLPAGDIVVRVSADDAGQIAAERLGYGDGAVRVMADSRLGPGDVVVTSSGGDIDARVETVLEEAAAVIRDTARQAG